MCACSHTLTQNQRKYGGNYKIILYQAVERKALHTMHRTGDLTGVNGLVVECHSEVGDTMDTNTYIVSVFDKYSGCYM